MKKGFFQNIRQRFQKDIYENRIALIVILLYFILMELIFKATCPFRIMTGLPCPACGMTRAGMMILHGHFAEAAHFHIMIYPTLSLLAVFLARRYILGLPFRHGTFWCILLCICFLIYYIYRMILYFPHQEPLIYYPQNILHFISKYAIMSA